MNKNQRREGGKRTKLHTVSRQRSRFCRRFLWSSLSLVDSLALCTKRTSYGCKQGYQSIRIVNDKLLGCWDIDDAMDGKGEVGLADVQVTGEGTSTAVHSSAVCEHVTRSSGTWFIQS